MIFFKICSSHFCWTTSLWRRATARSISALETLWQDKFKLSFDKTKIYDLVTRCLFICFKTRASCRVLTTQLNLFPIRRHQFWIPRSYWGQGWRLAIARPPKFSSFVMISLSPSLQLVVRYQLANTFCFSWYPSYSGTIREPVGTEYCCILITHLKSSLALIPSRKTSSINYFYSEIFFFLKGNTYFSYYKGKQIFCLPLYLWNFLSAVIIWSVYKSSLFTFKLARNLIFFFFL